MNDDNIHNINKAIQSKYAKISQTAIGKFNYPTGKEGAIYLGYDVQFLNSIPDALLESFCGVGNPFSLGAINLGETVLDVGCGAGFDLFVARSKVGPEGKVCGIDLTTEMVNKAKKNLLAVEMIDVEVLEGSSEAIPYNDETFDVVTSNGVLNLSPIKQESFQEIYRVLKPNGRLQFADIVLKDSLPVEMVESAESWSN